MNVREPFDRAADRIDHRSDRARIRLAMGFGHDVVFELALAVGDPGRALETGFRRRDQSRRPDQVDPIMDAAGLVLSAADLAEIDDGAGRRAA